MIPKKVIVVGAGGIGSHFVPTLVKLLRYTGAERSLPMYLIDGDVYEEKNRARQHFSPLWVGTNKAVALAEDYGRLAVTPLPEYLNSAEQFAGFCARETAEWDADADVLLICICVDNDATRRMIYDGVRDTALNFLIVDMANELHTGDVIVSGRGKGEMLFPWPVDLYPNLANPGDRPPQAYCTDRAPDQPQIVTTNAMAAILGAEIVRKILTNEAIPMKATFDFQKMQAWPAWE